MIRCCIFDLDGTLLDHRNYEITETSTAAIHTLQEDGMIILLATGRDLSFGDGKSYAKKICPFGIVHCNGQKVTIGDRLVFERTFSKNLLKRLFEYAKQKSLCIGCNKGDKAYFTEKDQVERHDIEQFGFCKRVFENVENLLEEKVYSLNFYGDRNKIPVLQNKFPELKFPVFSSMTGADIIHREASKAEGISRILSELHVDWNQVIAFGDSENDIEMLRAASIGIAMGNGTEEVKSAADMITDEIGKNGIGHALERLGLLPGIFG